MEKYHYMCVNCVSNPKHVVDGDIFPFMRDKHALTFQCFINLLPLSTTIVCEICCIASINYNY